MEGALLRLPTEPVLRVQLETESPNDAWYPLAGTDGRPDLLVMTAEAAIVADSTALTPGELEQVDMPAPPTTSMIGCGRVNRDCEACHGKERL